MIVAGEHLVDEIAVLGPTRAVETLEEADAALASFWPDAAVVCLPWTDALASWVDRNLLRYGIRTVAIGAPGRRSLKGVVFVTQSASATEIVAALRPRAA
jgi:hypothetical protein